MERRNAVLALSKTKNKPSEHTHTIESTGQVRSGQVAVTLGFVLSFLSSFRSIRIIRFSSRLSIAVFRGFVPILPSSSIFLFLLFCII